MNETAKEVAIIDVAPSVAISQALETGADLEKLEKVLDLQLRWEANEAKKAYVKAMAAFKASPPEIEKDKRVSFPAGGGRTEYSHASLSNVTKKINEGLSKHGLSAAWTTNQSNGTISVTCKITHEMGHSEETTLTASPDTSGSKNSIQAIGSTISYLERYTLLALTGLATTDMDDDGKSTEAEYINDKQHSTIRDLIDNKNIDETEFLAYMKTESTETILLSDFPKAMQALKRAKGRQNDKS